MKPGLFCCAQFCAHRALLYGCGLRLFFRFCSSILGLVVDLKFRESIFQALWGRIYVALRDQDARVTSNLLNREGISPRFTKACQESMPQIIESEMRNIFQIRDRSTGCESIVE